MRVVLRPDAQADVAAAVDHYRAASEDLVEDLLEELDRLLTRLSEFPRSARPVQGYPTVRRALLHRFPFAGFYTATRDVPVVLRVVHTARYTSQPTGGGPLGETGPED